MKAPVPERTRLDKRAPFIKRPIAFIPIIGLTLILAVLISYFSGFNPIANVHAAGFLPLTGIQTKLAQSSAPGNAVDPNTPVTIVIGLRIHNQNDLEQYVKNTSSAKNKLQRTLTKAQIIQDFSPYPAEQQAVVNYMQQSGFTTTATFDHRLMVGFTGTIGQAEQAFSVSENYYTAKDGKQFYASSAEPKVPAEIAPYITTIDGLDNIAHYTYKPISPVTKGTTAKSPAALSSATTSCVSDGKNNTYPTYYSPNQITKAYNLGGLQATYKGSGQTVGLIEFADYQPANIAVYTKCYGGASVPTTRIAADGKGAAINGGTSEAELDMELVLSTAPHLGSLNVYEAQNSSQGNSLMWARVINDAVPVVSTSWGQCEADMTSSDLQQENALFAIAAAQGQSILAAAGDNGSTDCLASDNSTGLQVDDPGSQPYVTSVGGTSLHTNTAGGYSNETVWNDTLPNVPTVDQRQIAGGGGISTIWPMPVYQQNIANQASSGTPCAAASGYCREVPDVSFNADPYSGYPIYTSDCSSNPCKNTNWQPYGGTSTAAPMFAALVALDNQYSLSKGYYNLGFLNPLLYGLDQNTPADFNDITVGNNNVVKGSLYPATTGYDMATGLGTPTVATFTDIATIAANTTGQRPTPAATKWYFAEGSVGNGFQEFLSILNPSITQGATVNVTYLFPAGKAPISKSHYINPSSRGTISVMSDLNIPDTGKANTSLSAIVESVPNNNGIAVPIVAERPMYFNFGNRVYSGTDVIGATDASQTNFYFPLGDTRVNGTQQIYNTFVTMLNPSSTTTANVTATFYSNGQVAATKTLALGPMQRGTLTPPQNQQVSMKISSDIGIVAERPLYFQDNIPNAGGNISGAATTVGATALGTDWLFAEGSTHSGYQENLILANFTGNDTTAQVKLEYTNAQVQTVPVTVKAYSQTFLNIHDLAAQFPQATTSLSIAVHDDDGAIVAERQIFFTFTSILANGSKKAMSGVSDTIGEASVAGHTAYSFAEGYTAGFNTEFLTLQNPSTNTVHAAVTVYADNTIIQKTIALAPQSRTTINVNSIVVPMAAAYPVAGASNVSLVVQGLDGKVVAERVYYFSSDNIKHGGTAMLGYTNDQFN